MLSLGIVNPTSYNTTASSSGARGLGNAEQTATTLLKIVLGVIVVGGTLGFTYLGGLVTGYDRGRDSCSPKTSRATKPRKRVARHSARRSPLSPLYKR
jgi:hypothetical protein